MGQKNFCLTARKNAKRKKYAATTTIPLIVSIPKVKLSVQDLASLQSQLCSALMSSSHGLMKNQKVCFFFTPRVLLTALFQPP